MRRTRTATWINTGTDVRDCGNDVDRILEKAHLDYTVDKSSIFLPNGFEIKDRVATIRKEDGTYIGVVSPTYEIYQNADAFRFISEIPNIDILKAGETHTGLVYMIGKLPDVTVLNDTFEPYVIFQTSHNGRYNVRATICPLRFVCQNQFSDAFKHISNTIDIRHSRRLPTLVAQAQELLTDTSEYMAGFTNSAEELAMLKIASRDTVYQIIDKFFDSAKEISERQKAAMDEKKEFFMQCYLEEDNREFQGTVWGLANAFSDYMTHRPRKNTAYANESAFMSVTFDNKALSRFVELASSFAR